VSELFSRIVDLSRGAQEEEKDVRGGA
jgi:hypothetical protein